VHLVVKLIEADEEAGRMTEEKAGASVNDAAREGEGQELEAEQESAEAMDAETDYSDVPEPPGASRTTEGQPS
jgi:hypothetical protein